MNSSLLSFLCVSYNHEKFIENCMKSIWNNDYKNIEVIVLDDGSKDNSVKILNKLKEQSPFSMKIIAQENTGNIGANFNKLISEASGEFLSFISCDDMVIENTIFQKIQELVNNKNLAYICHSKIIGVDNNGERINTVPPLTLDIIKNPTVEDILNLDYKEIGSYYIQGAIYRKAIIDNSGGFDDDMICDDIIFRTKLSRYMLKHPELELKVLKTPAIYYRRHENNISSNALRQVKGVMQYYRRYWNDKELPEMFYKWLYNLDRTDLLELIIADEYKIKIFNNLDNHYIKSALFPLEYPYKIIGIPYIFAIYSFKISRKKIKHIKLFNIKIFEYTKEIK